jgi:putative hydrolase of the HAD superfamily
MIELVGFDADDTLWRNEHLYSAAKARFARLLAQDYTIPDALERLDAKELDNLQYFGYGIKSFTLSMVETAVAVTCGKVKAEDIQKLVDFSREMLGAQVELYPGARAAVSRLSTAYPLILITKGDLFEQTRKVQRSGLAEFFRYVEIVADKTLESYRAILAKYQIDPRHFVMIGNSLRSDIYPVLALGGRAVYIPDSDTWSHESQVAAPEGSGQYDELAHLEELPGLIASMK